MGKLTAFRPLIKKLIPVLCVACLFGILLAGPAVSVQTLRDYSPENPILAAILILALYALKSATLFFPLIILEIATGYLFPHWIALFINLTGMFIILSVPYLMGKARGINRIQQLIQKYPRFQRILDKQEENSRFLCFFLRIISCLPGDVVTMYFGAVRIPFAQNLGFGLLGLLPGMVLATLMGSSIQDPSSPAFWLSAISMGALAVLSLLLYYLYQRKIQKKELQTDESTMV